MPIIRVALDVPLMQCFDYRSDDASAADVGCRVRVPFGQGAGRERIGIIIAVVADDECESSTNVLKTAHAILRPNPDDPLSMPPLPADWFGLCRFCADYYHVPLGEVMLSTLPALFKRLNPPKARRPRAATRSAHKNEASVAPELTLDQQRACTAMLAETNAYRAHLLFGITGSGKTEVYLRLIEDTLARGRQVLLLVPEINLTPQLEQRVGERFAQVVLVSLHSQLGETARARNWLAAVRGDARIVLGTRLAVLTPFADLGLIIVDEEHDASYKQQDGIRYSARDIAVFRARALDIPIVLGSATPSLETWANAKNGRYSLLKLEERAVAGASLPRIMIRDIRNEPLVEGIAEHLITAIDERIARGEQSLVFLNRRGYAPVLACPACGWVSHCSHCSANLVVHLIDRRLRCHHCGFEEAIARACPDCGNQDIQPFGRGTQRLEACLEERLPHARILRIDRDSTKNRKQWQDLQQRIHSGEADILIGTQMLAKGHDFPALTLVGVLGADAALFSADWRAPERLFAQLIQVAGRAGRAERPGEVVIQTRYPEHPLYRALAGHDYLGFADTELTVRKKSRFPPYTFQAMLRAEAKAIDDVLAFLRAARDWPGAADHPQVVRYDVVPMLLARRAGLERAQLLVESESRPALQRFLTGWRQHVETANRKSRLRWHLEIDPVEF